MQGNVKVIGMDCATDAKKVGLAMGTYRDHGITLLETKLGSDGNSIAEIIMNWIHEGDKVVFAIDAPLGWPENLGNTLFHHLAGQALSVESNLMFRRETDRFIKKTLGKQPLDVGADRIARTAHAALKILGELQQANNKMEMAWNPEKLNKMAIIEVYPAATLQCYGIRSDGYKEKGQQAERDEILNGLRKVMDFRCDSIHMRQSADVLDSTVCLLAANDFLNGDVYFPSDLEKAKKEGWIWVKKVSSQTNFA
ncbi:MAG: DUF429 domain-containing protein [Clostridia bacterium]|nr:DUF429 domain-containing protein [Clostridia bacterium]